MKKTMKRLLAMMMAAVMVLTVLPLGAISVFADAQDVLEAAIGRYDTMVTAIGGDDGYNNLVTNLVPAYEKYIDALRVLNNVDANGDIVYSSDQDMRDAAAALNAALDNCQPFEEYTTNVRPTLKGWVANGFNANSGVMPDVYPEEGYYNKIIYTKDIAKINASNYQFDPSTTSGTGSVFHMFLYYPDTVILDDGDEEDRPVVPVIFGFEQNSGEGYLQFCYESIDNMDLINKYWKGDQETKNNYSYTTNRNTIYNSTKLLHWNEYDDDILKANGDSVIQAAAPGDNEADEILRPYKRCTFSAKNALKYYRSANNNNTLVPIEDTEWLYCYRHNGNAKWSNAAHHTETGIYVINYKKLIDSIKASLKRFSDTGYFSREYIEQAIFEGNGTIQAILMPLYEALDAATSINPSNYDYENQAAYTYKDTTYDAGMPAAAAKCADDIDNVIYTLDTVKPDNVLAAIYNLRRIIEIYEGKMNGIKETGEVLSHMKPAYEAYQVAKRYVNAYDYGLPALEEVLREDATANGKTFTDVVTSVDEVAKDLTEKTEAMQPMHYGNYDYIPDEAFQCDSVSIPKSDWYNQSFQNLVWVGKAPERTVGGASYDDTGACGIIRLNQEYNTTNLYVPRAVSVYDNDGQRFNEIGVPDPNGKYIASIPVMVGYKNDASGSTNNSGTKALHNYVIADLTSDGSKDDTDLEGDWVTGYESDGTTVKTQHMLSLADISRYGVVDKLNAVENSHMLDVLYGGGNVYRKDISVSANYTTAQQQLFSHPAETNQDAINVYEYFANRLLIACPEFASSGVDKYIYKINNFKVAQTGTQGGNTSYTSDTTSSVRGDFVTDQQGTLTGWRCKSVAYPSIVILNFSPVHQRIENGKSFLTQSDFDISEYSEGGLNGYISDLSALTDLDPANIDDYEFDNGFKGIYENGALKGVEYFNSQKTAEECAQDMYNLLEGSGAVTLPDTTDPDEIEAAYTGDAAITKDVLTIDDGDDDSNYYYELMEAIKNVEQTEAEYDLTCIDLDNLDLGDFDAALYAAQLAMAKVSVFNYAEDKATVLGYIEDIRNAAAGHSEQYANAPRTQHAARYDHRKGTADTNILDYETAIFKCSRNEAHVNLDPGATTDEHNLADMSVYDPLQAAVDTIDYGRYTNDHIIQNAEVIFDRLTDENVAMRTVGADAETPQEMVDDAITKMLTALTEANKPDYASDYDISFSYYDKAEAVTAVSDASLTSVEYGNTVTLSVPESAGWVYKWVLETGNTRKVIPVNYVQCEEGQESSYYSNAYTFTVQADMTVTAYCKLDAKESYKILTVTDLYRKPYDQQYIPADRTVKAGTGDTVRKLYTEKEGTDDVEVAFDTTVLSAPGYTFNEFSVSEEDGKAEVTPLFDKHYGGSGSNGTFRVGLAGQEKDVVYDTTYTYNASDNEAIGVAAYDEQNAAFVPVAYGSLMNIKVFGDLKLYPIYKTVVKEATSDNPGLAQYYIVDENDQQVPLASDYQRLALDNGLPFAYTVINDLGNVTGTGGVTKKSLGAFTVITEGLDASKVSVVEKGTVYTSARVNATTSRNLTEEDLVLENVGRDDETVTLAAGLSYTKYYSGIRTIKANYISEKQAGESLTDNPDRDKYSQFSVTIISDKGMLARGYVKYKYTLNGETINAIVYSNLAGYNG